MKFIFLLLSVFCFLSCQDKNAAKTSSNNQNEQSIIIGLASKPKTLDPRSATDANGMRISHLLYSSLVKIGPNLEIEGDLAETWSVDYKTYKFVLKSNLKFSNGRKITKEDLDFSFSEYQKKSSPFSSAYRSIEKIQIDKKSSLQNKTEELFNIEITLKNPSATFLTDLSPLKILPKQELLKFSENFWEAPITSGAYSLEKESSSEIILSKNKHYFDKRVKNEKLHFKIVKDDNTRVQKLLKGELELVQGDVPPNKIKIFSKKNQKFNIYKYPGLAMSHLLVNLKDSQLKNLEIRKAINYAINRKEIIKYKLSSMASKATSILTPKNPYFNDTLSPANYSIDKAKELIAPFLKNIPELTIKSSTNPSAVQNANIIAKQLEAIGLKTKVQSYEWGTFYGDISKGNFQLATMRWVGATDPDIYRIAFHSSEFPPGRNRGSYSNAKLDKLLDEGLKTSDIKLRKPIYKKVQKIIHEELPIIPLWYNHQATIINSKVKGYEISNNGDFSPLLKLYK